MKIHLDASNGRCVVRGYEPGRLHIDNEVYEHSLILMPERVVANWRPRHFGELDVSSLAELAAWQPEVVVLGTGSTLRFPPAAWLAPFFASQVGVECMDTGAACRTYNLLMSEGRSVVAGLLLADPPSA
jgi:uncharacterized protein